MFYILGLLIAVGSLVASIIHLGQSASSYYDMVGFTMVIGGTLATAAITLPWDLAREIFYRLRELFYRPLPDRKDLLLTCMRVNEDVLKGVYKFDSPNKDLSHRILKDGVELIQLGFSADKIQTILKERLFQATERTRLIGTSIRSLSKYPPAFGLAGTVLGLVHLMRGVSDGMTPQETGIRMAIALIATFYGLLVANLIVNPAGEAISKHAHEEEKMGEIALQAVLLAADRMNMLETQEMLNSFVDERYRVDVLGLSTINEPSAEESIATPGAA
ncbi:MAG: MotA/TolQ/ExbB proton channel family protein [Bdellovibrionales bacterium]|nr:MotA/TolQ/ExbB proton channel family protein [Bdellovibrionales bacterium]